MATVPSITNITKDPTIAPTTFTHKGASVTRGPFQAPEAPSPVVVEYTDIEEFVEKSPLVDNGNWSEIKKSGAIVMSDYFHRRTEVRNFIVGSPNVAWVNPGPFAWTDNSTTPPTCAIKQPWRSLLTTWTEQGDSRYWSEVVNVSVNSLNSHDDEVKNAIATSQSSVVAAFKGGFDALTQVAESREALSYFRSKNDEAYNLINKLQGSMNRDVRALVKKGATAKDLLNHSDSAVRQFGKRWMEYRYAILPLIYAYKDIKELQENVGRTYETFKSKERISLSYDLPSGLPIRQLLSGSSGEIIVTSTIKAGYAPSGYQSFVSSQLQTNLFATALELIPLSFVLGWFVNVGDYIIAHTSSDRSMAMKGCTAVRKRVLLEEWLHDFRETRLDFSWGGGTVCYPTPVTRHHELKRSVLQRVKTVFIDHYDRTTFTPDDVDLSLYNDPFKVIARYGDAASLSYKPLKKLLRSLL